MWNFQSFGMMSGAGWGSPGSMMLIAGFWVILLLVGLAGAMWFVRGPRRPIHRAIRIDRGSPALDRLEDRYARGEIDRDAYLRAKCEMLGREAGN